MIYSIYKITNIVDGKLYIGFSSTDPDDRWYNHQRCAINSKKNAYLYNAMRKYGNSKFMFEVIYQSTDYKHTHKQMENYFIVEYRSFIGFDDSNGYNMTLGGEGSVGRIDSKETTEKRSKAKLGKSRPPMSEEQKIKLSLAKKNIPWTDARRIAQKKIKNSV